MRREVRRAKPRDAKERDERKPCAQRRSMSRAQPRRKERNHATATDDAQRAQPQRNAVRGANRSRGVARTNARGDAQTRFVKIDARRAQRAQATRVNRARQQTMCAAKCAQTANRA